MKRRLLILQIVIAAIVAAVPLQFSAQENRGAKKQRQYRLVDLGTFGGPQSYVNIPDINYAPVLNNRGVVAAYADTATPDPFPDFCFVDCFVAHALRFRRGAVKDLGALPGGGSSQANWISENGLIAGFSENGQTDPLVPGIPEVRAVLWDKQKLIDLGTLDGGYQSLGMAVNSSGQVAGFATTTVPDPDSMFGLGFQTRAVLWQDGAMQDLGTLGTGTNAVALLINEEGQIAGNSYTNSQSSDLCAQEGLGSLTTGAFVWDRGKMVNIGSFGGSCTFASSMNNRGDVVGGSRFAGDQVQHPYLWNGKRMIDLGTFGGGLGNAIALNDAGHAAGWSTYPGDAVFHAALWKHGSIKDLGVLDGDSASFAFSINAADQVVGISVPPDGNFDESRTFFWENGGPMVDLASLVVGGSSLRFAAPETINDRGEIAGNGVDADGNIHAFLLIPCNHHCESDASTSGGYESTNSNPHTTQSIGLPETSSNLRYFRGRKMGRSDRNAPPPAKADSNADAAGDALSCAGLSPQSTTVSLNDEIRITGRDACTRGCGACNAASACGPSVAGCTVCGVCQRGRKRQVCNDRQTSRRCYRYVKCAK